MVGMGEAAKAAAIAKAFDDAYKVRVNFQLRGVCFHS